LDFKKLIPREGSRPVIIDIGVAMEELCEAAELGIVVMLEWHVAAPIVSLNNIKEKELFWLEKNCQKRSKAKHNSMNQHGWQIW